MKIICSDVDGTLLKRGIPLSEENRDAIALARSRGVHFCICTGRFPLGVEDLVSTLALDEVCISAFNGGYISVDGECIFSKTLSLPLIRQVFDCAAAAGAVEGMAFGVTRWFVIKSRFQLEEMERFYNRKGSLITGKDELYSLLERERIPIYKLVFRHLDDSMMERLFKELDAACGDSLSVTSSAPSVIEVMPKGVCKANAVNALSRYFGVPADEVMAIGDYYNDIEMLKAAGISVAMGNGCDEAKRCARYETARCEEHGVAQAILRFL